MPEKTRRGIRTGFFVMIALSRMRVYKRADAVYFFILHSSTYGSAIRSANNFGLV